MKVYRHKRKVTLCITPDTSLSLLDRSKDILRLKESRPFLETAIRVVFFKEDDLGPEGQYFIAQFRLRDWEVRFTTWSPQ
jgi:hypothetical protein